MAVYSREFRCVSDNGHWWHQQLWDYALCNAGFLCDVDSIAHNTKKNEEVAKKSIRLVIKCHSFLRWECELGWKEGGHGNEEATQKVRKWQDEWIVNHCYCCCWNSYQSAFFSGAMFSCLRFVHCRMGLIKTPGMVVCSHAPILYGLLWLPKRAGIMYMRAPGRNSFLIITRWWMSTQLKSAFFRIWIYSVEWNDIRKNAFSMNSVIKKPEIFIWLIKNQSWIHMPTYLTFSVLHRFLSNSGRQIVL